MNDFLGSLKADLTDRRLLPVVALAGFVLVAAVAYALLGGGGSSGGAHGSGVAPVVTPPTGLAVTATTTEKAVAETPDGAAEQRKGVARNPFAALPAPASAKAATTSSPAASSAPASSSTSPSTSSGTSGSSGETPSSGSGGSSHSSKPSKPKTVYHVALLFGVLPAGTTPETAQLTPYENVKLLTPLPSAKQALVVFRGVTAKGNAATFSIVGEVILHGSGKCLPEPAQCQALDLKPGQTEQFEYTPPGGEPLLYELRVVSIAPAKASAAKAASLAAGVRAGRELLRRAGLVALPFLRHSSQVGVLVFAPRHQPLAHGAARHHGR